VPPPKGDQRVKLAIVTIFAKLTSRHAIWLSYGNLHE
jgi:hypothetical protein